MSERPLLLLEKPLPTEAVCFGHRVYAVEKLLGRDLVAVFAHSDSLEPCATCNRYGVEFPTLTEWRVSYWAPSQHPSMYKAVALCTAVLGAEPLPGF